MPPVRVRYQTIEFGNVDIHVRSLRDKQQFSDPDGEAEALGIYDAMWPLFGQVWPSSRVLGLLMVDFPVGERRVLEVGCGLALASLVLNQRGVDVTATDHHPEFGRFLKVNVALNDGADIPTVRTDWDDPSCSLGKFDLIIGSELLYERGHVESLSAFIDRHAAEHCEVLIVDPGRGHLNQFGRAMQTLGYTISATAANTDDGTDNPYSGKILRCVR